MFRNGRRPQLFWKMKDNLKFVCKVKMTSNVFENARQPQIFLEIGDNFEYFCKWMIFANTIISMHD